MHREFLQQAIALAKHNVLEARGGPFGALIVKEQQIIAAAGNQVTATLDPTAHAEIRAIREACLLLGDFQLKGCVLYSSCEPCPMCLGAIYWARLQAVYFACGRQDAALAGFDDSLIYSEINLAPTQRKITMQQLETVDALSPFSTWQAHNAKVCY